MKHIVITGASSGLGESLALELSHSETRLILIARDQAKLQSVVNQVKEKGGHADCFVCDLTKTSEIEHTAAIILEKYDHLDILINNAGIWFEGPTVTHSTAKVQELFQVNAVAPIVLTKALLPQLIKQHSGQILNVISSAGLKPSENWGVYTGTKYALRGFTESLNLEVSRFGIKVIGFFPGGMDTPLFTKAGFKKENEPWMMNSKEIAKIIAFTLNLPSDMIMPQLDVQKFYN